MGALALVLAYVIGVLIVSRHSAGLPEVAEQSLAAFLTVLGVVAFAEFLCLGELLRAAMVIINRA